MNSYEQMREALVEARDALSSAEKYIYGNPPNGGSLGWNDVWPAEWHNAIEAVEAALSAPPRNCDVGTAEEQAERMRRQFCAKQKRDGIIDCSLCPIRHAYRRDCTLAWAQMTCAQEGDCDA